MRSKYGKDGSARLARASIKELRPSEPKSTQPYHSATRRFAAHSLNALRKVRSGRRMIKLFRTSVKQIEDRFEFESAMVRKADLAGAAGSIT